MFVYLVFFFATKRSPPEYKKYILVISCEGKAPVHSFAQEPLCAKTVLTEVSVETVKSDQRAKFLLS